MTFLFTLVLALVLVLTRRCFSHLIKVVVHDLQAAVMFSLAGDILTSFVVREGSFPFSAFRHHFIIFVSQVYSMTAVELNLRT